MTIGELIVQLGFKADTPKLKDFIKGISELNLQSIVAATGFGALFEAGKKAVEVADELGTSLNKFKRETHQSTDNLQRFTQVAEEMGVPVGVIESAVRSLQQSIFRMQVDGEGSNVWNMLGIDPRQSKDKFEILTQLRERFKTMSIESQQFFLNQLGISQEMLNLFAVSDKEWSGISERMVISAEQLEKINEYHKAATRLGNDLKIIWADIGVALTPVITKLAEGAEWLTRITRESWVWKGIMDSINEVLMRTVDGWKQLLSFGFKSAFDPGYADRMIVDPAMNFMKGAAQSIVTTAHNTFHIKSTDPVAAGREAEERFRKSIGQAYFSRSNGEH